MSLYYGEQTWPELEEHIKNEAVIILPIGTTEEHGLHLPVETDSIIAKHFGDILAKACDERGIPVLLMRTIYYGFSMGAVRYWPGCPNVKTRVFTDYIQNIVSSLIKEGFRKIVMLDCHGNHDCLLRLVMREIADEYNVFTMTLSIGQVCGKEYDKIKKDPEGDIHGGEWETSLILAIDPALVKTDEYTEADAIRCNTILRGPVSAWGLQETTTGIFGNPLYASAELGRICWDAAVVNGVNYVEAYYKHKEQSKAKL